MLYNHKNATFPIVPKESNSRQYLMYVITFYWWFVVPASGRSGDFHFNSMTKSENPYFMYTLVIHDDVDLINKIGCFFHFLLFFIQFRSIQKKIEHSLYSWNFIWWKIPLVVVLLFLVVVVWLCAAIVVALLWPSTIRFSIAQAQNNEQRIVLS